VSTYIPRPGVTSDSPDPIVTITATANGVILIKRGIVVLAHASVAIAATFGGSLAIGADFTVCNTLGGTHTLTLPSGMTFDGTNNRVTLDTANEYVRFQVISSTRVIIVGSSGAAYSAV